MTTELKQRNKTILDKFADGWVTVLIDHTYNRINLYDTIGLNHAKDLGEDHKEWLTDDLFTYIEIDKDELTELSNSFIFY